VAALASDLHVTRSCIFAGLAAVFFTAPNHAGAGNVRTKFPFRFAHQSLHSYFEIGVAHIHTSMLRQVSELLKLS